MTTPALFGYWDLRGMGQPIRYLLEYTGMPWEEKLYTMGGPPDYDKSSWLNDKFNLGLDFPNNPYFIDGPVKLTQSKAIMKYIARKYGLDGKTEQEKIRVDLLDSEQDDFRGGWGQLCYNPDFENLKVNYLKELPNKLGAFSRFLGTNPWFAGENITYVDFSMYEFLDQHTLLDPDCLKPFQNLVDFQHRFEKLDKIAAYQASPRCIKYPLNGKMAKFGG